MSVKKGESYIAGRAQVDATPTSGSNNAVSSGGVYTALQDKAPASLTASVAALDSALSAKANDSQVVHLAGDETITDAKTFQINGYGIRFKNTTADKTAAPAGLTDTGFVIRDKNNQDMARFICRKNTNGQMITFITCQNSQSGSEVQSWFQVVSDATGNTYATAPASNVVNSIVITSGRSFGPSGYVKFGNGLIIQWGVCTLTASDNRAVTFSTAFSSASSYVATANPCGSNNTAMYTISVNNRTTTGCTLYSGGNVRNFGAFWIAIGY